MNIREKDSLPFSYALEEQRILCMYMYYSLKKSLNFVFLRENMRVKIFVLWKIEWLLSQ